jgi:hypothetical protein
MATSENEDDKKALEALDSLVEDLNSKVEKMASI